CLFFFFSSRRRHTRWPRDWSSDVCSSDLVRQMAIEWGVTPILIPEARDVDDLWNESIAAARAAGLISAGDRVVITAGTAVNIPRSEERRVGKEWKTRWATEPSTKQERGRR